LAVPPVVHVLTLAIVDDILVVVAVAVGRLFWIVTEDGDSGDKRSGSLSVPAQSLL
jgi:hypothetical protein